MCMKLKKLIFALFSLVFMVCACMLSCNANTFGMQNSYATESSSNQINVNYSIFMRKPTYSTKYGDYIYFYDNYDGLIKQYSIENGVFSSKTINLSNYQIQDASSTQKHFVFLASASEKQYLLFINLESFDDVSVTELNSSSYSKIDASLLEISSEQKLVVALSHDSKINLAKPAVVCVDTSYANAVVSTIELSTSNETLVQIQQNLFKFVIERSNIHNNELFFIFFYDKYVRYESVPETEILTSTITISKVTAVTNTLATTDTNLVLNSISKICISNKNYIYITYIDNSSEEDNIVPRIYAYNFAYGATNTFECVRERLGVISCNQVLTNENFVISSSNQTISYTSYDFESSPEILKKTITNPSVSIDYLDGSNPKIKTLVNNTSLLSSPWSPTAITEIQKNSDVIYIGDCYIEVNNSKILDYIYCLCTKDNTNFVGYIKVTDLKDKDPISLENYDYKVVTVVPNTNLYSYPTKVLTTIKSGVIEPELLMKIEKNSRIEILDPICNYTANNTTFVKVKVNYTDEGYIDVSSIIVPNAIVDFVVTNSFIKQDDTIVYLNTESNSPIIDHLDKNFRVRINGARDTKSGYTSITYNDEYGNEFNGYIKTDMLSTDSWTTLQIIGCVLIAINIGLLVLILIFKKHNIGQNGTTYLAKQKENYKKKDI